MTGTIAQQLFEDSRFADGKKQLLDLLAEYQSKLTGIKPPAADRVTTYDHVIARFGEVRGGKLFYPFLGSGFGNGPWVELNDGSVKLDMITGIGVHILGHSHPALVDAGINAAMRNTIMQGNLQQNEESITLSRLLINAATAHGGGLKHCFLSTSGAMANENAFKLAFSHHAPADRVLAFEKCFMGRTMTMSHVTDRPGNRAGLPHTINVDYVPFFDATDVDDSTQRAVTVLRQHISRYPGRHALMSFETVQGEGGYYPGERQFFVALCKVLREHNITIMIDEIQTFGRTSRLFAFQHFGLDEYADIVTIGKMSQVCATLFTDTYVPKPGLISQTFTGATASIFAAITLVEILKSGNYFGDDGRVMQLHRQFVARMSQLAHEHPTWLSGPFGLGGMMVITPFDGSMELAKKFIFKLYDNGVIAFIAGGGADAPVRARFLPPIGVLTDEQMDIACDIIAGTFKAVAAECGIA